MVVSPTVRCGGGPTPWAAGWSRSRPGAGDLNGALAAAAAATTNGSALLVVTDLPLASATGLERVLAVATAPVAVVQYDGGGTNVLAWR